MNEMLKKWLRDKNEYKLCLVLDKTAYFTNIPIEDQTGDDWNDAPYEYNAGEPYPNDKNQIIKLMFEDGFFVKYPCDGYYSVSVDDINKKTIPWITIRMYDKNVKDTEIYAGETIRGFIEKMHEWDIGVYINLKEEK